MLHTLYMQYTLYMLYVLYVLYTTYMLYMLFTGSPWSLAEEEGEDKFVHMLSAELGLERQMKPLGPGRA